MLSASRRVFRSESECKGTTFSRNTKQNKNFFSTKTIFFRTKGTKDAFIGNFEEFFECKHDTKDFLGVPEFSVHGTAGTRMTQWKENLRKGTG